MTIAGARIRLDRRALLAAGLATALSGCATAPAARRARRPLGIADITVMRDLLRDYPGTLRRLAAMGHATVGMRLVGYRDVADARRPCPERRRLG